MLWKSVTSYTLRCVKIATTESMGGRSIVCSRRCSNKKSGNDIVVCLTIAVALAVCICVFVLVFVFWVYTVVVFGCLACFCFLFFMFRMSFRGV